MPAKKIEDWSKEDVIKAIHSLQKRLKFLESAVIEKPKLEVKDVPKSSGNEQQPKEDPKQQDWYKKWK